MQRTPLSTPCDAIRKSTLGVVLVGADEVGKTSLALRINGSDVKRRDELTWQTLEGWPAELQRHARPVAPLENTKNSISLMVSAFKSQQPTSCSFAAWDTIGHESWNRYETRLIPVTILLNICFHFIYLYF